MWLANLSRDFCGRYKRRATVTMAADGSPAHDEDYLYIGDNSNDWEWEGGYGDGVGGMTPTSNNPKA